MDKLSLQEVDKYWFWRAFFRLAVSCKDKKSPVRIQLEITVNNSETLWTTKQKMETINVLERYFMMETQREIYGICLCQE